jgi:hypothetical protein
MAIIINYCSEKIGLLEKTLVLISIPKILPDTCVELQKPFSHMPNVNIPKRELSIHKNPKNHPSFFT